MVIAPIRLSKTPPQGRIHARQLVTPFGCALPWPGDKPACAALFDVRGYQNLLAHSAGHLCRCAVSLVVGLRPTLSQSPADLPVLFGRRGRAGRQTLFIARAWIWPLVTQGRCAAFAGLSAEVGWQRRDKSLVACICRMQLISGGKSL